MNRSNAGANNNSTKPTCSTSNKQHNPSQNMLIKCGN